MKSQLKFLSVFAALIVISTQISAQYTADYDKNMDFTKFKTYAFAGWQNESDKILNDFDKQRIQSAFKAEFDARGMQLVEKDADAVVTLFVAVSKEKDVTAYTNYVGGYGYRYGWGWGVGFGYGSPGYATTSYSESEYMQGTLVADVFDASTKELAWQGVIQTVVEENPKKREKTIPKKVYKLMKQYPVKPVKKKK